MNLTTHPIIELRIATVTGMARLYLRRVAAPTGPRRTRAELEALTDEQRNNEVISQHLFDEYDRRIAPCVIEKWPEKLRRELLEKIAPWILPPLQIPKAYRG